MLTAETGRKLWQVLKIAVGVTLLAFPQKNFSLAAGN